MPCEHFSVRRRFSLVEIKFRVPFLYYECPSAYLFVIVIYVFTFFFFLWLAHNRLHFNPYLSPEVFLRLDPLLSIALC